MTFTGLLNNLFDHSVLMLHLIILPSLSLDSKLFYNSHLTVDTFNVEPSLNIAQIMIVLLLKRNIHLMELGSYSFKMTQILVMDAVSQSHVTNFHLGEEYFIFV